MQTQQLMMRITRVKVMKAVLEFLLIGGGGLEILWTLSYLTLSFDVRVQCAHARLVVLILTLPFSRNYSNCLPYNSYDNSSDNN